MEKKIKSGMNVMLILGTVFSALGLLYTVIGLGVGIAQPEAGKVFPLVFGGLGLVFLALGLAFLGREFSKRRKLQALVNAGRYVWGSVVNMDYDTHIRINDRNPQVAIVQYSYGGQQHYFTSRHLPRYCSDALIGQQVKIYCNAPDFSCYYVDMEPLLENHILH